MMIWRNWKWTGLAMGLMMLAITAVSAQETRSVPVMGTTGTKEFNGHFYKLYTGKVSPAMARRIAERDGGYLLSISSKAENDFIAEWLSPFVGKFLIGAVKDRQGIWRWSNGEEFKFENWSDAASSKDRKNRVALLMPQQTGGAWQAIAPAADFKVDGFLVEFIRKPKELVQTSELDALLEAQGRIGDDEAPAAASTDTETPVVLKDLPSSVGANSLYSDYLFAGGKFRPKYLNQTITVTGVAQTADIGEIPETSQMWNKYKGKFIVPILGNNVIGFMANAPLISDDPYVVIKMQGTIAIGPAFKQILIEDARLINFRKIMPERKFPNPKRDNAVLAVGKVGLIDNLLNEGNFELIVGPKGEKRTCRIRIDGDGYALELYWLLKTGKYPNLMVQVSGIPIDPEDKTSDLTDCRLVGWSNLPVVAGSRPEGGRRPAVATPVAPAK